MTGDVIKEFLVGLGFDIDSSSLAAFGKAIAGATIKVTALYASVQALSAGIFKSISGISEDFEQMGYEYRLIAPAINKALILRQAMLEAYSAAGVNLTKVIQQSIRFNLSLAKTQFALKAIYMSVGAKFFPLLTKQLDIFRQKIFANMPKIQAALETFVKYVFKAFEVTIQLGTRVWEILEVVYNFFKKLHDVTDGWSTVILAVIAAWKLLNLSFLATPIGFILEGLLAIVLLWDDFKVWREGGKSLFNWSYALPIINGISDALGDLWDTIKSVFQALGDIGQAFWKLFHGDFTGAFKAVLNFFNDFNSLLENILRTLFAIVSLDLTKVVDSIKNWIGTPGGQNTVGNLGNGGLGTGAPAVPLGATTTNNNGNTIKVDHQTQINVNGSADAHATGAAVASQQTNVVGNIIRNATGGAM